MTMKNKKNWQKHRAIFLSLLFATTLLLSALAPQAGWAVSLKKNAVISGDSITLGDLFSGLTHGEDRVLGPAPRPGQDMVLNARTLLRVARALDLPWRPVTTADYIVVKRAASVIGRAQIEDGLRAELAEQGIEGKYNLILPNEAAEIILPRNLPAEFEVASFNLRQQGDWFEATLVAPSAQNPVETLNLHGSIERLIDVPILSETIRNGVTIGKNDISYLELREKDLNHDIIINEDNLIGMTARRMVLPGKPIRQSEIEAPQIVKRGEFVTMVFQSGTMQLSARGKALENGSKGDSIRVVNTGSNRTIEGIVSNVGEVKVITY